MSERLDTVIALAGEFTPDLSSMGPGTQQRMDAAIAIVEAKDIPLVVSGNYPFRWRTAPPTPLAHLMKDYAVDQGVPADMVIVQDKSLDTIGDALFTKIQVTEPRGWRRLALVTSDSHLPRSERIFAHVMGPEYQINAVGSGPAEAVRLQRLQEFVGNVVVRAVLAGTEAGDTPAIRARLFGIIPGYSHVPTANRLKSFAAGLLAK